MMDNLNTEDTGYIDSAPSNIVTGEKECLVDNPGILENPIVGYCFLLPKLFLCPLLLAVSISLW